MELTIYKQNGDVRAVVSPTGNSTHSKQVMGDNVLNLSFVLDEYVKLAVNDYIEFQDETFNLLEDYRPLQKSTIEYEYDVQFYGIGHELKKALVLFMDGDYESTFPLTDTAEYHLQLVVDNINRIKGTRDWNIGELKGIEEFKLIQYDNTNCFDALRKIAETFETEWWIEGTTINLSRCEHGGQLELSYEKKGLKNLSKETNDQIPFFTRLFPIGSTRNIDKDKYGYNRLRLPGGAQYVEKNTHLGIVEYAESEAFSHIYPRRVGTVSSVRESEVTVDGEPHIIYFFKDDQLPFDPNDYEIHGSVKNIIFQSGNLSGQGFEVNYNSDTREFEIINQYPYENMQIPGGTLIPIPGDEYIIYNISMPDEYYTLAENELEHAVGQWLDKFAIDPSVYKASSDPIYFEEQNIRIRLGQRVKLISLEYFDEGFRDSRITGFSRKINNHYEADLEFSYAVSAGRLNQIENNISNIEAAFKERLNQEKLQVLKTWDSGDPTDYNVFSSLRARFEFISKQVNDVVNGILTFIKRQIFHQGAQFGESYASGLTGTGGLIDGKGNGELESLFIRRWLEVPEIRYNRNDITIGNSWRAPGAGIIESVDTENQIITLKLEDGEIGAVKNGDICMGIFHSFESSENAIEDTDDSRGNFTFAGFFTVYFTVVQVLETDNSRFKYQLRPESTNWNHSFHPREAMHFVSYGNFTDEERQTSMYETRTYRRMLWKQNTWEIGVDNIAMQDGDLTNLNIHGLNMKGYSTYLNNVYFTGTIRQVKPDGTPVLVVNDRGQWVTGKYDYYDRVSWNGGLWLCVNEDGTTTEPSNDNNSWLLQVSPGNDGSNITNVGEWVEDKFIPYLGIVRIGGATYQCINKDGVTCSYIVLTDEDGNDLTDENDSDLLSDEIDMANFVLIAEDGDNGIGITNTDVMYAISTSATTVPTSGWQTTAPTWEDGKYIWSKTEVTYTDGTVTETAPVCITGGKGSSGVGVKSIVEQYYLSTSPTTLAGGSWQGTSPTWQTGKYIWTRSVITYTDGIVTTTEAICVTGEKGDSITHFGNWVEDKFVPYLGIVRIDDASWMCINSAGTTCSYLVLTDESGNDLTDENDYDLLSDEIDLTDFVLVAEDGVGVESIIKEYYLSSSQTVLTGGSWTTSRPSWINNWYLWTRDIITYSDGSKVTGDAMCITGQAGKDGAQGCIIRHAEWKINVEWRNDEDLTSGTRYLDVALVRDTSTATGWVAYKCKITHTASAANAPGNTTYWEEFGSNVASLFTSLIIAKDASIEFLQGNQLLVKDDMGNVIGGISGKGYQWMGGSSPDSAKNLDRADGSGHRANKNIIWDEAGRCMIRGGISSPYISPVGTSTGVLPIRWTFDLSVWMDRGIYNNFFLLNVPENSSLILPDTLRFVGSTINFYVGKDSQYGLSVRMTGVLNKTSYTISPGGLMKAECVGTETKFIGWYIH